MRNTQVIKDARTTNLPVPARFSDGSRDKHYQSFAATRPAKFFAVLSEYFLLCRVFLKTVVPVSTGN